MKVAYFSPLSPQKSGISTYSENNLLPYLKKFCELELIIDKGYSPSNNYINDNFKIIPYTKFRPSDYDVLLYNLGNNTLHEYIYKTLLKYPGVVIIHDPFIHGLIWNMTIGKNDKKSYVKYWEECLGGKGKKIAENSIATNHFLDFKYPLVHIVAKNSLALLVHSNYAKQIISKESPQTIVKKINHPTPLLSLSKKGKEDFNISKDTIIISTFGFIASHKRLNVILKAFRKFLNEYPNSKFLIIGKILERHYLQEIKELIEKLKISEKAEIVGYKDDLVPYIQISDIIIQLRYPTAGETSGMTLEIMRQGKPIVVSNTGWFKELPDDCVKKIDTDENEEKNIVNSFLKILNEKAFKEKLAEKSKKYVINFHNPEKIAFELYNFIKYFSKKYEIDYIHHFSEKIHKLGVNNNDKKIIKRYSILLSSLEK